MVFLYAKLGILATVALTILRGKSNAPYFPIEISRLAESHERAYIFLLMGTISSGFLGLAQHHAISTEYAVAWLGLFILALFDDKDYWLVHMMGVVVMIGAIIKQLETQYYGLLLVAIAIYISRIVAKLIWLSRMGEPLKDMKARAFRIMYGKETCPPGYWFQWGGLGQWISLFILLCIA